VSVEAHRAAVAHDRDTPQRGVSPGRALVCAALGAWASLFWFLLLSGRTALYLSSRTDWVVPVGALILSGAFVGRLFSLRVDAPEPLSARAAWGTAVIVLPVITVLALPPASLGAFAAVRRPSWGGGAFTTGTSDVATGELSLLDVAGGLRSPSAMKALAQRAGEEVSFTGFVTRAPGEAADEFVLTRFVVSCCVAATAITPVDKPKRPYLSP
jgi:hypothetical protein